MRRILASGVVMLIGSVAGIRAQPQQPKISGHIEELLWWLPQLLSLRTFTPVTWKCFAALSMWRSFV
jgi:hypothetical protein